MMINFRPMSFHCSSTACEGLGAGFGGSFFAASCASAGIATNPVANAKPATHFGFIIFSFLRNARTPDVLSFRRAILQGVSPPNVDIAYGSLLSSGGSSYAVLPPPSCSFHKPAW
jgi:hypothetical protein